MKSRSYSLFSFALLCCAIGITASPLEAHEMRPAFLELKEDAGNRWQFTWKVPARGPDARLALDVRLPDGCQWTEMPTRRFTGDAFVDQGTFEASDGLDGKELYIEGLSATFTDALVQIRRLDGSLQSARLESAKPSMRVEAKPKPGELFRLYFRAGLDYLRQGWDHLLFLAGLLVFAGSLPGFARAFAAMLTASLIAAVCVALDWIAVPSRWTEVMIALGLVALAVALTQAAGKAANTPPRDRGGVSPLAFGALIGIVHGFGFAASYGAAGMGAGSMRTLSAYLMAISLGLMAAAVLLALAYRWGVTAASRRDASSVNRSGRFRLALSYGLGVSGVFLALYRF